MRERLLYLAFFVFPLAAYFPALTSEYGKAGDYAMLRAAHGSGVSSAPATGGSGETVMYQALLDSSFKLAPTVSDLWRVRMLSVLLLALLGILIWRQLDTSGWPEVDAAAVGLLIILLPAAQVLAGWALAWPRVLALLFTVAGFAAVETELEAGGLKRAVAMLGGVFIYALAAMIRPELTFFALVPLGAILLFKIKKSPSTQNPKTWLTLHARVLAAGFFAGRLLEHWASGDALASLAGAKAAAVWFFRDALPNSLALCALRDDFNTGAWYFWIVAPAVAACVYGAFRLEQELEGEKARFKAAVCMLVLPGLFFAGLMLVGALKPTGYRDAMPLAGLIAVALLAAWRTILRGKRIKAWMHSAGLAAVIGLATFLAQLNVRTLIAEPQTVEWELMKSGVAFVSFKTKLRVHLITARVEDRTTQRRYGDEFGPVSSRQAAVAREMLEIAVSEKYAGVLPKGGSLEVTVGGDTPGPGTYDVLVDMRKLKNWREQ